MKQFIAVRAVIEDEAGRVLIIREATSYKGGTNAGRYDLPGGKVEPGESLTEAVHREVREECGLEVEVGEPFFAADWHPRIAGRTMHIFETFFRCRPSGGTLALGPDHDESRWLDLAELASVDLLEKNVEALRNLHK